MKLCQSIQATLRSAIETGERGGEGEGLREDESQIFSCCSDMIAG